MYQKREEGGDAPLEQMRQLTPFQGAPISPPSTSRLPSWMLPAVVAVLTLALVATGTWGVITAKDLNSARNTVDQQNEQIAGLQTDLAQEKTRGDGLAASVASLQARVKNQDACISALAADASTLSQVTEKLQAARDLIAEGSVWAKAAAARTSLLDTALDDYYQAYLAAFKGSHSSANTWIGRGNSQYTAATDQTRVMNEEIAKANQLLDAGDGMLRDYQTGSSTSVCTTPSSGSST